MRLAEKERTYLTPIQSENDFNLNSKTFEYSVGILSIVIIFLCTDSSCARNFIPTKIYLTEKTGEGFE